MATATTIVVSKRHRIGCFKRYIEHMGTDIPTVERISFTGAGFCSFYIMTFDAQSRGGAMKGGSGFFHLMIGTDNHRMTAQALGVVTDAAQLMTVGARSMHAMAAGTGQKKAVVAIFGRLDEVGVLLMV